MVLGMSVSKLATYRSSERKYCKYYRLYILNLFVTVCLLSCVVNSGDFLEKCYLDNVCINYKITAIKKMTTSKLWKPLFYVRRSLFHCKIKNYKFFSPHCLSQKRELIRKLLQVKIDLKIHGVYVKFSEQYLLPAKMFNWLIVHRRV